MYEMGYRLVLYMSRGHNGSNKMYILFVEADGREIMHEWLVERNKHVVY